MGEEWGWAVNGDHYHFLFVDFFLSKLFCLLTSNKKSMKTCVGEEVLILF